MQALINFIFNSLGNIINWVNKAMVALINGALFIWPSTPGAMRPSYLVAQLQATMPGAPWWMLGDLLKSAALILSVVIGWKVAKMVRG